MATKERSGSLYDSVYVAERTRALAETSTPQRVSNLYDASQVRPQQSGSSARTGPKGERSISDKR